MIIVAANEMLISLLHLCCAVQVGSDFVKPHRVAAKGMDFVANYIIQSLGMRLIPGKSLKLDPIELIDIRSNLNQ